MEATIEKGVLIIRIPVNTKPTPSKSGKTLILASSGGNKACGLKFEGVPVVIGVNAYYSKD